MMSEDQNDDHTPGQANLGWGPKLAARLAGALLGAALGGGLVALLEAYWSASVEEVSFAQAVVPSLGLVAPMSVALGVSLAVASLFLHPDQPPSLASLARTLEARSDAARAESAWFLCLAFPVGFVWVWFNAKAALGWLTEDIAAVASGLALGLGSVGSALVAVLVTRSAASLLARRYSDVRPVPMLLMGGTAAAVLTGAAIALGTTSGTGGMFAVFGVFKRPELDLRASFMLLVLAASAYLGPALLKRLKPTVALPLAALPLLALFGSASALEQQSLSLGVERGSALGKRLLPMYRKLSDADGDGFGSAFGGGDCNDADRAINPGADDVPENGVDEDCSGSDAKKLVLDTAPREAPKDAKQWMQEKLNQKFNVLLLTVDTLRFDLGFMGYQRPVSPNIDKLAKKSAVFEQAYALASYTAKSLPPMLIGKYPSETHRGWSHFNRFSTQDLFIQERLQKAGLRTVSVQGYWYFFHKGYGFERGFDVLDSSAAPKVIQMEGDRSSNSDKLSDAAIEQLKTSELQQQQFFMWVHYIDPHAEYAPHEGFDFGSDSRARYDGEVAFVDHHLGRVLEALAQQPYSDRTLIILTSDHGEAFGEHGMIRHGFEVWEELVRVPLIVYFPGAKPNRIEQRRSIIDVVPTILEAQGVPLPSGEGDDFISGRSLLADVLMPPGHEPEERIVFVDMSAGPHNAERQAFIEDDKKLIASSGRTLGVYDLDKDPGEKQNLSKDEELSQKLSERYKAFRRELKLVNVKPQ